MNTPEPIEAEIVPPNAVALRPHYEPPAYMTKEGRQSAVADTLNKVALVMEIMDQAMSDGEHYGKIPGCGDKKALLKPGAEKLGMTFRLRPQFEIERSDFQNHHREYQIKCILSDGTQGVGSCSTLEAKYRYRAGERKCPKCGKAAIIKGKQEFGGGWLCFAKKDGCGAKFNDDDKAITGQQTGKVEHDNPADFWNTCLKMAKKRAHVDAIITATACSDIFTQDVEEATDAANAASAPSGPQHTTEPVKTTPSASQTAKTVDSAPVVFAEREEKAFRKAAEAQIERERASWVTANTNPQAWAWACTTGELIMQNEPLTQAGTKLFPLSDEWVNKAIAAIKSGKCSVEGAHRRLSVLLTETKAAIAKAIEATGIGADEHRAFEAVYGPPGASSETPAQPAQPRSGTGSAAGSKDAPAVAGEWFWSVICPIPNKGQKKADYEKDPDTIAGLYKAAKANDDNARKRLFGFAHNWKPEPRDYNGKTYQPSEADLKFRKALDAFLEWEEVKGKAGAAEMRGGVDAEENQVPF